LSRETPCWITILPTLQTSGERECPVCLTPDEHSAIQPGSFCLQSERLMVRLEDPRLGSWVKGVLPDALVQVIDA